MSEGCRTAPGKPLFMRLKGVSRVSVGVPVYPYTLALERNSGGTEIPGGTKFPPPRNEVPLTPEGDSVVLAVNTILLTAPIWSVVSSLAFLIGCLPACGLVCGAPAPYPTLGHHQPAMRSRPF